MKLDRLFKTTEWTEELLAEAVGANQSTINRLRRETRTAGAMLAVSIEAATGGKVRVSDLPMTPQSRSLALMARDAAA